MYCCFRSSDFSNSWLSTKTAFMEKYENICDSLKFMNIEHVHDSCKSMKTFVSHCNLWTFKPSLGLGVIAWWNYWIDSWLMELSKIHGKVWKQFKLCLNLTCMNSIFLVSFNHCNVCVLSIAIHRKPFILKQNPFKPEKLNAIDRCLCWRCWHRYVVRLLAGYFVVISASDL